jgi:hypothetical protein
MAAKGKKKKDIVTEPVKTVTSNDSSTKNNNILNKLFPFIFILVLIILFASLYLNVLLYLKKKNTVCPKCKECKETIVEEKKVNIEGYIFDLLDEWKITLGDNKLSFTNNDETMSMNISINAYSYEKLTEPETLKKYLETFQIDENCFLKTNVEKEKNGVKYYYLEGTQNGYNFINIIAGKEEKTFSITATFENEQSLENNKEKIVDFLINASKNTNA